MQQYFGLSTSVELQMHAVLSPGQKQGQMWHGLGTDRSSVNTSAQAERLLGTENLTSLNGPTIIFAVLHRGLKAEQRVLLTHGDSINDVAKGFQVIARSDNFVAGQCGHWFGRFKIMMSACQSP